MAEFAAKQTNFVVRFIHKQTKQLRKSICLNEFKDYILITKLRVNICMNEIAKLSKCEKMREKIQKTASETKAMLKYTMI